MAKGTVTLKSLRSGQTVYRVSGSSGIISKLAITSRPFVYKKKDSCLNGTVWVNCRKYFSSKFGGLFTSDSYIDDFSLTDAGIGGSHRNSNNRTFYTYKAAKRWSDYVKSLPKKIDIDDLDIFDILDYWYED